MIIVLSNAKSTARAVDSERLHQDTLGREETTSGPEGKCE